MAKKQHLKPIELELLKLNDAAAELLNELTHIRQREARTEKNDQHAHLIFFVRRRCIV